MKYYTLALVFLAVLVCLLSSNPAEATYFGLSTNKVFTPGEEVSIELESEGLKEINMRIYSIDDPIAFFRKQKNLHNPTIDDTRKPNFLDMLSEVKNNIPRDARNLGREKLDSYARTLLLDIFGMPSLYTGEGYTPKIPPLRDYNLIEQWKEPIEDDGYWWNYQTINLDIKKIGVYLIEAYAYNKIGYTVLIVSNMGFITKRTEEQTLVYTVEHNTGIPLKDVNLHFLSKDKVQLASGRTDKSGLFLFKKGEKDNKNLTILASKGEDFCLGDPYFYYSTSNQKKVYVYTDRPVYRPGQEVFFKGIIREIEKDEYNNFINKEIIIEIKDTKGDRLYKETLTTNEFGSFSGNLILDIEAALGSYRIKANIDDKNYYANFKVEEYKKPEYKVEVRTDKNTYMQGDTLKVEIKADYYFGSPVANADVQYYIYRSRYWRPWWQGTEYAWYYSGEPGYTYGSELLRYDSAELDEEGWLRFTIDTDDFDYTPNWNYSYRIQAKVVDKSRREITGQKSVKVMNAEFSIDIRTDRYVYAPKKEINITLNALDVAGKPKTNQPIKLKIYKRTWDAETRDYEEESLITSTLTTDIQGNATFKCKVKEVGHIRIEAEAEDKMGHKIIASKYIWISKYGKQYSGYNYEDLEIIMDKDIYEIGETAHIMIISPISNAYTLICAEANDIYYHKVEQLQGNTMVIDIPITKNFSPNAFITVSMLYNNTFYYEKKLIVVPSDENFINIAISSDKERYQPQDEATFEVLTTNSKGNPISAEISIGIIDESIYAIAPESTKDIQKFFYNKRWNRVQTYSSLSFRFYGYSRIAKENSANKIREGYKLSDFKANGEDKTRIRKDFKDAIYWNAHLTTNAQGYAKINIRYPDNLTTWRTTVRAITKDTKVGSATYKTITRKDLIVRLELPRFFTQKDEAAIAMTVHNYLDEDKDIKVDFQATGIDVLNPDERTINVPRNGVVSIDWQVKANKVGTATFTAKAITEGASDGLQLKVPIQPHGLLVAESFSEELDDKKLKVEQILNLPIDIDPTSTKIRIGLSPSIAATVLSSLDYLAGYPYGCVEQTMSRFLPSIIVASTMQDMNVEVSTDVITNLPKYITAGFKKLRSMQHSDGGWGWWTNDDTHPFMTAYVVYGLALAELSGHSSNNDMLKKGVKSLEKQLQRQYDNLDITTRTYMLHALSIAGQVANIGINRKQFAKFLEATYQDIIENPTESNPYAQALLALALHESEEKMKSLKMIALLEENVNNTNNVIAYWGAERFHYSWENDTIETTSCVLKALISIKPNSPLISASVRYLVSQRRGNSWRSSKDTALIVFSLVDYMKMSDELTPNYTIKTYLNDTLLEENLITEKEVYSNEIKINIAGDKIQTGKNILRIEKTGKGKLYVTSHLSYYTKEDFITSRKGSEFNVKRTYYLLEPYLDEGNNWVYKKKTMPNVLHSGDEILVKVKLDVNNQQQYFMLEEPIAAGCEIIKDESGYTIEGESNYAKSDYYSRWWWPFWWSGKEIHDDHIGFFATNLYTGTKEITYILRCQIPGEYRVLPSTASLMYYPEVRSNGDEFIMRIAEKEE